MKTHLPPDKKRRKLDEGLSNKITIEVEPSRIIPSKENKCMKKDMVFINGIVSQPKTQSSTVQPKILVQLPHKVQNHSLKLTTSNIKQNNQNKCINTIQANVSNTRQFSYQVDCSNKNQTTNFVGKTLLRGIKPKLIGKEKTTFTAVSQLGQQIKVISPSKVPSSAKIFKADSINTTKSVKFIGTPKKCQHLEKKTAKFGTSLPPKVTTAGYRTPSNNKFSQVSIKSAEKLKSSPYGFKNEYVHLSRSLPNSKKSLVLWDADGRDLNVSFDSSYDSSPACSSTSSCIQTPSKAFLFNSEKNKSPFTTPGSKNKTPVNRKEKSLGLLCEKFLNIYASSLPHKEPVVIALDQVSEQLQTGRRRIYDIINVLESILIVERRAKNNYTWRGYSHLPITLNKLISAAETTGQAAEMRYRISHFGKPNNKNVLENLLLTEVERTHKSNKKRDKSLGVLSRRFVAMFLIHPKQTITLDMASKILHNHSNSPNDNQLDGWYTPENSPCPGSASSPFPGSANNSKYPKIRRLYDIANILCSLRLIKKHNGYTGMCSKKPMFSWIGPTLEQISNNFSNYNPVVESPLKFPMDLRKPPLTPKLEKPVVVQKPVCEKACVKLNFDNRPATTTSPQNPSNNQDCSLLMILCDAACAAREEETKKVKIPASETPLPTLAANPVFLGPASKKNPQPKDQAENSFGFTVSVPPSLKNDEGSADKAHDDLLKTSQESLSSEILEVDYSKCRSVEDFSDHKKFNKITSKTPTDFPAPHTHLKPRPSSQPERLASRRNQKSPESLNFYENVFVPIDCSQKITSPNTNLCHTPPKIFTPNLQLVSRSPVGIRGVRNFKINQDSIQMEPKCAQGSPKVLALKKNSFITEINKSPIPGKVQLQSGKSPRKILHDMNQDYIKLDNTNPNIVDEKCENKNKVLVDTKIKNGVDSAQLDPTTIKKKCCRSLIKQN